MSGNRNKVTHRIVTNEQLCQETMDLIRESDWYSTLAGVQAYMNLSLMQGSLKAKPNVK